MDREKGNLEKIGEGVGGITGKVADTAVNWMTSILGSAANRLGGWWSDQSPDQAVRSFGPEHDQAARQHFDSNRSTTQEYDAVRPLYQFGHLAGSNPDYQGRSFDDVESELKNAYSGDAAKQYGEWRDVRSYVERGYSL